MPNNAELARLAATMYAEEFGNAYMQAKNANFGGDLSPEQVENVVNKIIVNHAGELYRAFQAGAGNVADTAALPQPYLAKLAKFGNLTDDDIAHVAQFAAPGEDRTTALKRWTSKAQKLGVPNARKAADPHASPLYDPNYDIAEESEK